MLKTQLEVAGIYLNKTTFISPTILIYNNATVNVTKIEVEFIEFPKQKLRFDTYIGKRIVFTFEKCYSKEKNKRIIYHLKNFSKVKGSKIMLKNIN